MKYRRKILRLTPETIIKLVMGQTDDLPDDVEARGVHHDFNTNDFWVAIHSMEFPVKPEGAPTKKINPQLRSYQQQILDLKDEITKLKDD